MSTITVIETTHAATNEEWGDANFNHLSLLAAVGVTTVDQDDNQQYHGW